MRKFLLILVCVFSLSLGAQESQDITVAVMVQDLIKTGDLNSDPLVVMDNQVLLDNSVLNTIKQDQVATISIYKKRDPKMVDLYGSQAKNGVVVIELEPLVKAVKKVLWILDDQISTPEKVQELDPLKIESVKAFIYADELEKYPELARKHITGDVSGVIMVYTKQ